MMVSTSPQTPRKNNTGAPAEAYTAAAEGSVTNLHKAGVTILGGSDANTAPFVPANPPFGDSLHDELEPLVMAGLSPADALRGATSLAASSFGFHDRGQIKMGYRADLVLLGADPTTNIQNSRSIKKVWAAGVQSSLSLMKPRPDVRSGLGELRSQTHESDDPVAHHDHFFRLMSSRTLPSQNAPPPPI
ncbi:hypothetical protein DER44DRAFT_854148 [Fusarium oxysporum]|nr:hypothetical protein DER44DRAFT_854148 [Fusarium oxysporum]